VGSALALGAARAGLPLAGLGSRSRRRAEEAAQLLTDEGLPLPVWHGGVPDPSILARTSAEVLLLCIADPELPAVARDLAAQLRPALPLHDLRVVLHSSGSLSAEALAPLRELGLAVGSLHPLLAFTEVDEAARALSGATFGIEGDAAARQAAAAWARALGGEACEVPSSLKPLYHAAAVMAANYAVALLDGALELATRAGLSRQAARAALGHLAEGALQGAVQHDTPAALTGPIARGDLATVAAHLEVIEAQAPALLELYAQLGQRAALVARARGGPAPAGLTDIERRLAEVAGPTGAGRRRG
jgi:predicted short-subunit dehydrogenase-like oxidoreductase (DUF2520 family)